MPKCNFNKVAAATREVCYKKLYFPCSDNHLLLRANIHSNLDVKYDFLSIFFRERN